MKSKEIFARWQQQPGDVLLYAPADGSAEMTCPHPDVVACQRGNRRCRVCGRCRVCDRWLPREEEAP
jgi:hypothetical protein